MGVPPLNVIFEDNHLLAVSKPALLPTMGVAAEKPSLIAHAKAYLKHKYRKPGNVFVGVVSRLDAPVSGVVLMARTSKAAGRLAKQFRDRDVEKIYWAVVDAPIRPRAAELVDWLRKDERHRRMHVAREGQSGTQQARLSYQSIGPVEGGNLVEIRLETGRKHQIRVQLANQGFPIRGDRKYGSRSPFSLGIALHARRLRFEHPVRKEPVELVAELPPSWRRITPPDDGGHA